MSDERKGRYINYLVDRLNEVELDKKAMELVLEDFLAAEKEMKEELAQMRKKQNQIDSKLDEAVLKRKNAERKVEKLKSQLEFTKKNKFGGKQQKMAKNENGKPNEGKPDRNNEKEKFDGTEDTIGKIENRT